MRSIIEILLYLTICFALINYGAVDLMTVSIVNICVYVMLVALITTQRMPNHIVTTFFAAAAILALSGFWIIFQTTPLPGEMLANPAWREVKAIATTVPSVISLTPEDDKAGWLRIAAPFGVFMIGLPLFSSDEKAERALFVISISGGLVAFLSLLQFYLSPQSLLFGPKTAYYGSLTGFFVNRNTAATYLGLNVLLAAALLSRDKCASVILSLWETGAGQRSTRRFPKWETWGTIALLATLLSCFVALMLTKSRGGIGSTFVAALFLLLMSTLYPSHHRSMVQTLPAPRRRRLLSSAISICAIVAIFFLLGQQTILRAEILGTDDGRLCIVPGLLNAIDENFPWGTGLSSFLEVFSAYRDPSCGVYGTWDMAHNFFAEGVITLGVAFPILVVIVITWLAGTFAVGVRQRRSFRFAPQLGLASLILVVIHSIFDFSLQVSGMAIFYAAMLAPLTTISLRQPGPIRRSKLSNPHL